MSTEPRTIHDALTKADLEYSAYSCSGVNLFGDRKSIDAAAAAFHSHSQIDWYQRNLRHWRDECGKLHAKIAILKKNSQDLAIAAEALLSTTPDERHDPKIWFGRVDALKAAISHIPHVRTPE